MWALLGEFGFWILLGGFLLFVLLVVLLWLGPFLALRWIVDRVTGRTGVVEEALKQEVAAQLNALKQLSRVELLGHKEKGGERSMIIAGRKAKFLWELDLTPPWDEDTNTIVLWYELYLFNLPFSPTVQSVNGFKITPSDDRIDLTPLELADYD